MLDTGRFSEYLDGLTEETAPGPDSLVPALVSGLPKKVSAQNILKGTIRTGRTIFGPPTDRIFAFENQSDSKIVLAGRSNTSPKRSLLARLLEHGDLDTDYGTGGFVSPIFVPSATIEEITSLAILDDNSILAGGFSVTASAFFFTLCKLTTTGALDTAFGSGGKVTLQIGVNTTGYMGRLYLQDDGKILLAGWGSTGAAIARFNADGFPDTTFGTGGLVTNAGATQYHELLVQSGGKIIVAGYSPSGAVLVRYSALGVVDATWGTAGTVTETFSGITTPAIYAGLAEQSTGKVIAVGNGTDTGTGQNRLVLGRYATADGALDITFGTSGKTVAYVGVGAQVGNFTGAGTPAVIEDDAFILGCSTDFASNTGVLSRAASVIKFHKDGTIDYTWGSGGLGAVVVNLNGTANTTTYYAEDVGEKIVFTASRETGGSNLNHWAVMRLNKWGELDQTFGVDLT